MTYNGFVLRFGSYTPQQIEQVKKDFNLSMPLSMLGFCASYFRKQEKRDPAIEELMLLDLLYKTLRNDSSLLAPTELMTNDAFVAETYSDMMQKRKALYPTAKTPCTIREAFFLATGYLVRAGKEASLPNRLATLESCAESLHGVRDNGLVPISETNVALHYLHKNPAKHETGDQFLLLLPAPTENPADYDALMARLFATPALTKSVKCIRRIGENGLLYELLQMTNGITLSLPRLSRLGERMPLSMLVTAYQGKYVVSLKKEAVNDFEASVGTIGLRAMHFAYTTCASRVSIMQEDKRTFSWNTDFLRALCPIHPITVRLANETTEADAPIHHLPNTADGCKYLMHPPVRQADTYYDGAVLTSVAASRPKKNFFRNALDTALTAVLTLAVSGCHYSEQRLAISLTLPKNLLDSHTVGEGVSTVLGLYRLQTELGIPLIADKINAADDIPHPLLTVFSTASGSPCPIHLQGEGNYIYCIMPQLQKDGLSSFLELRKLLAFLSELRNRKILQSARILSRESITDTLTQMRTETLSCRLTGDAWAAQGKLPLAILLETSEPLNDAKEVARVLKRNGISPEKEEETLPYTDMLIQTDTATVTVIAQKNDMDAYKLCDLLKQRGATVTLLHLSTDTTTDLLAQSIFGTQTLIVCQGVSLPHDAKIDFAIETISRGGGRILFPNRKKSLDTCYGIALENGLSEKMLDQICILKK